VDKKLKSNKKENICYNLPYEKETKTDNPRFPPTKSLNSFPNSSLGIPIREIATK